MQRRKVALKFIPKGTVDTLDVFVTATVIGPFAIHRRVLERGLGNFVQSSRSGRSPHFVVTHTPTGYSVSGGNRLNYRQALEVARRLLIAGDSWNFTDPAGPHIKPLGPFVHDTILTVVSEVA